MISILRCYVAEEQVSTGSMRDEARRDFFSNAAAEDLVSPHSKPGSNDDTENILQDTQRKPELGTELDNRMM